MNDTGYSMTRVGSPRAGLYQISAHCHTQLPARLSGGHTGPWHDCRYGPGPPLRRSGLQAPFQAPCTILPQMPQVEQLLCPFPVALMGVSQVELNRSRSVVPLPHIRAKCICHCVKVD